MRCHGVETGCGVGIEIKAMAATPRTTPTINAVFVDVENTNLEAANPATAGTANAVIFVFKACLVYQYAGKSQPPNRIRLKRSGWRDLWRSKKNI